MKRPYSLKIGISGVRGVVGDSLTPQLVTAFACAYGAYTGPGPILIGTDSRPSREMVKHAAIAGLLSVGCTPIDVGIVPVPALQLHIRDIGAFGGICITASHNPIEWNALKFFGADGILLRPAHAAALTDVYRQGVYPRADPMEIQEARSDSSTLERHARAVLGLVDVETIRRRRLRVAVDCCNGAASVATPAFLRALGCEVHAIYTDPNSPFPHNPEPLPENIQAACQAVQTFGADVGFVQDADADRLAAIDERGQALGEETTLALAVRHFLGRERGPVVVNVSTSRMIDDVARAYDVPVYRTRVGEVNVVEAMIGTSAVIGGEGNGGIIVPRINPCRDSFVGMALLLEAIASHTEPVSRMRAAIPSYVIVKEKIPCAARVIAPALRAFEQRYAAETLDLIDGVKVVWPDRWLQARGSNTEPIIRLTAEAARDDLARAMVRDGTAILRSVIGGPPA